MAGAATTWTYTGPDVRGYPDYADLETGRMLVAEPGGSYQIRPIDPDSPVPPDDGRWVKPGAPPPTPPPPPPSTPPAAGTPAPSPAAGGEKA